MMKEVSEDFIQFNGLSAAEHERLAILLEELGEAQQAIGKILRHGYESYNPTNPSWDNRQQLTLEIADVKVSIDRLILHDDINVREYVARVRNKPARTKPYLHHQG